MYTNELLFPNDQFGLRLAYIFFFPSVPWEGEGDFHPLSISPATPW